MRPRSTGFDATNGKLVVVQRPDVGGCGTYGEAVIGSIVKCQLWRFALLGVGPLLMQRLSRHSCRHA